MTLSAVRKKLKADRETSARCLTTWAKAPINMPCDKYVLRLLERDMHIERLRSRVETLDEVLALLEKVE